MASKKVQVFKGADKDFYVRMVAGNGRKLNVTEGYESASYARKFGKEVQKMMGTGTKFQDLTKKKKD